MKWFKCKFDDSIMDCDSCGCLIKRKNISLVYYATSYPSDMIVKLIYSGKISDENIIFLSVKHYCFKCRPEYNYVYYNKVDVGKEPEYFILTADYKAKKINTDI